jgi:hypothetical protein
MRPYKVRRFLVLAWFGVLFAGSLLFCFGIGVAKAEPRAINAAAVCAVLETHPTVEGVTAIIREVVKESGATPEVAFRGVTVAIAVQCPNLLPVLSAFIDRFSGPPELKQGYIA